jgi:hypothetical protein
MNADETIVIAGLLCATNPQYNNEDNSSASIELVIQKRGRGRPKGAKSDPVKVLQNLFKNDIIEYLFQVYYEDDKIDIELITQAGFQYEWTKAGSIARQRGRRASMETEENNSFKVSSGQRGKYCKPETILKPCAAEIVF